MGQNVGNLEVFGITTERFSLSDIVGYVCVCSMYRVFLTSHKADSYCRNLSAFLLGSYTAIETDIIYKCT